LGGMPAVPRKGEGG